MLQEAGPAYQLHREEPHVLVCDEFVQRYEIPVSHVCQAAEFLLEPIYRGGVHPVKRLEGDRLVPLPVVSFEDDPHPATADLLANLEALGASKSVNR